MKSSTNAHIVVLVVLLAAGWCRGQEPSPSYEHLTFLEPLLGQWQVDTTGGGEEPRSGVESSKWILNKSFMQHDGWILFDGIPVRYVFVTGWNANTEKVFQWGAGGNSAIYGFQQRIGSHDPQQQSYVAHAEGVISGDIEHHGTVKLQVVDKSKATIDFTAGQANGEPIPEGRDEFSRQIKVATPKFDETPGPAYEHLKPIEWLVGKWELRGAWVDGKTHEGGEQSKWVLNKNFIRGEGWWSDREGKRHNYVYMITWHPKSKHILMAICGDDGGHTVRIVTYDAESKTLTGYQNGVTGTGETTSADMKFQLTGTGTIEAVGTNMHIGEEALPDLKTTFSRK